MQNGQVAGQFRSNLKTPISNGFFSHENKIEDVPLPSDVGLRQSDSGGRTECQFCHEMERRKPANFFNVPFFSPSLVSCSSCAIDALMEVMRNGGHKVDFKTSELTLAKIKAVDVGIAGLSRMFCEKTSEPVWKLRKNRSKNDLHSPFSFSQE